MKAICGKYALSIPFPMYVLYYYFSSSGYWNSSQINMLPYISQEKNILTKNWYKYKENGIWELASQQILGCPYTPDDVVNLQLG